MKKEKIILGASAAVVALVSAFAFTSHNKKFGTSTLFTRSGSPAAYHSVPCVSVDQSLGACITGTATYYTSDGTNYNSKGVITPFRTN